MTDLRKFPTLPKYTDTERIEALNRNPTSTQDQIVYFAVLTQKVWAGNIHAFADCLIHYENFCKAYPGYEKFDVIAPDLHSPIMYGRLQIWLKENRKSTEQEEATWAEAEERMQEYLYQVWGGPQSEANRDLIESFTDSVDLSFVREEHKKLYGPDPITGLTASQDYKEFKNNPNKGEVLADKGSSEPEFAG